MEYIRSKYSTDNNDFYWELTNIEEELVQTIGRTRTSYIDTSMERTITRIGRISSILETIFEVDEAKYTRTYIMRNERYTMTSIFTDKNDIYPNTGLAINIEKGENETTIAEGTVLEVAQNLIKETPRQKLRIFTSPYNDWLYVESDRNISFNQFMKIKMLQWSIQKDKVSNYLYEVIKFYEGLNKENLKMCNEALNAIFNNDIIQKKKWNDIRKIFNFQNTREIETLKYNIKENNKSILIYENNIAECALKIANDNERLDYLMNKPSNDDELDTIIKYIARHPHIKSVRKYSEQSLQLDFEAPIVYYQDYVIEKIMQNVSDENKKILQIFLDKKYTLYTYSRITFDTETFATGAQSNITNSNFIGQPHIYEYACFGNHRTEIQNCALSRDYIGAIEQINQAVMNFNFTDSCVTNKFLTIIYQYPEKKTWKDEETGEFLSTQEVLERMNENEETQVNEN